MVDTENEVNTWVKNNKDLFVISIETTVIPYEGVSGPCIYIITIVYEES
jgi:hypothetical protein